MNLNLKNQRGFTLIELLVVVAIVGVLASVVLSSLNSARTKGRDARRRADIAQILNALELYHTVNGRYPNSGGATAPNAGWSTSNDASWTTLQTLMTPYISTLPTDPKQSSSGWAASANTYAYSYVYNNTCATFMLVYQLEIASGPDIGATYCATNYQYGGAGATTAIKTLGTR